MMPADARRCEDCLTDFVDDDDKHVTMVQRGYVDDEDGVRRPYFERKIICGDCAGWYRDVVRAADHVQSA